MSEPLEMTGGEAERSAVDAARGRERNAELVEQNLLARAIALQVGSVDALAQLSLDEEVAEHRKLASEVAKLAHARVAAREPSRVRVVPHDAVPVDAPRHRPFELREIRR